MEVLAAVAACPSRGAVLPHRLQPEGCGCGELSACASGRGKRPEGASLEDCVRCRWTLSHPDPEGTS
jgi:hypothetical protein